MAENDDKWVRMAFKNSKVWAETDGKGNFLLKNGKVRIKYNLKQDYEYMVHLDNLASADTVKSKPKTQKTSTRKSPTKKSIPKHVMDEKPDIPENAVVVYTDGACSRNPGPAGIGVVLEYKGHKKEIGKYIGDGTNNIAELTAIWEALKQIKKKELPVRLFTDSKYSFGVLFQGWKARANVELIRNIQNEISKFTDLKCYWVKGHADNPGNEMADKLATDSIKGK